jgi:tetratricopeptide (TPR) repeat protein
MLVWQRFVTILVLVGLITLSAGMTVDEYLDQADELIGLEDYRGAIAILEQGIEEYPESSEMYTKLGLLHGIQVQNIDEYTDVLKTIVKVFDLWDTALNLDPGNIEARFQRGVWGVNIPKFLGRTKQGVMDLDTMIEILYKSEDPGVFEQLLMAYYYLGYGLQRLLALREAEEAYNTVIEYAPETDLAQAARNNLVIINEYREWQSQQDADKPPDNENITRLRTKLQTEPDNIEMLLALAREYRAIARYDDAIDILQHAQEIDWANPEIYRMLALVFQDINSRGYDPRIALDTDFRTDLAFETVRALDMAVQLAPDDMGLRYLRGIASIEMPFFTGTLEQGIEDLSYVLQNSDDPSVQSEALFYIGMAYQKKAISYWGQVVTTFSDQRVSNSVFEQLMPKITRFDPATHKKPHVIIDFVLGFKDELPPQTAVWIEDESGNFIRTIYVSGFSGYAKDQQINLPLWSKSSEYRDLDAVTGASIDLGHHIYVWDLNDYNDCRVKNGNYAANIEVTFWPSMQYQRVEVPFKVGKKGEHAIVEQGNLVPYVEVRYEK